MGSARADRVEAMAYGQPAGRIGRPEEVVTALIYPMQNGYATGTKLDVDGEQMLR